MTCPVRAPDPVHICLTAERDREERVDAAPAVGFDRLTDVGGAVPAGLRFGVPERMLTHTAQVVKPQTAFPLIVDFIVVIELDNIELFVETAVVHAVEGHCIGTDRRACGDILMQNIRLHMDKVDVAVVCKGKPFELQMRIVPCIDRCRNLGKVLIRLTEQIEVPGFIECGNRTVLFTEIFAERSHAVRAAAAVPGIDLVVDLPADDVFVIAELPCHRLDNARGIVTVMGVVGTAVTSAAVGCGNALRVDGHNIGIEVRQPLRRCCGRCAHDGCNACFCQRIDDTVQP